MRVAFVGFGAQARENLIPSCQIMAGVEIAAICDTNPDRRAEAEAVYGAAKVFSDHKHMLDVIRPDAVVAACYPKDHFEIAMNAIARGISIFIEKPPAPTSAHLKILVDRAVSAGVTTGVGMNFRFADVTTRAKHIGEGQFNVITLRQFSNKPSYPLWDYSTLLKSFLHAITIHGVDFLIHLCGPVDRLSVVSDGTDQVVFTVLLTFKSGAHGSLVTGNTTPHFVFDFDAVCGGDTYMSSTALWDLKIAQKGKTYRGGETKKWTDSWAPSPLSSGFHRAGYGGQLVDFIDAARLGHESRSSFASLVETYRCIDGIEDQLMGRMDNILVRVS